MVKYQTLSKYCGNDCLQNFLLHFMSLSTAKFVKKSRIMARLYFIFVKNILNQPWKAFNTKFQPQSKDQNSSYQVRQTFALFFNLIALTLV